MNPYWEYVRAGYVLVWVVLAAYSVSLAARRREASRGSGGPVPRGGAGG